MSEERTLMPCRILLIGILISFLMVYVEWGKESEFFFQMQSDIFIHSGDTFNILLVPVVLVPFIGQLLLLFSAIKKPLSKRMGLTGIIFCSLPVILVLIGGFFVNSYKMIISTLPFFTFSFFFIRCERTKALKKSF